MNLPTPLMTLAEATEKHTQLKLLEKVFRSALLEMRDRKGYIALGFVSFEEYGEKEWGYSKSHIHRLATAEEIQQSLSPIGDSEIPESQLRPLGKVPKAARDEIYQQAKAEAEAEGKALTAKAVDVAVTNYLEKLNAAQTTIVGIESELQYTTAQLELKETVIEQQAKKIQKLEKNATSEAEKIAAAKLEIKQAEMEQKLDAEVARVEAENQAKIDEQKDIIARLQNTIAQTTQNENKVERDERYLSDLQEEIDEAHAALKKLTIESNEATAAKRTNHHYTGIAKALAHDVGDYIEDMSNISHLVDDNGNAIPLYPLTTDSQYFFKEVAMILTNAAKFINNLASYESK